MGPGYISQQKVNRSQKSTLLSGLRLGAGKLRRGANTGVKNPVLLPSAPGRQLLFKIGIFAKLIQKSLFSTKKHLFKSNNSYTTDTKHIYG
jgi:hypothetical protein